MLGLSLKRKGKDVTQRLEALESALLTLTTTQLSLLKGLAELSEAVKLQAHAIDGLAQAIDDGNTRDDESGLGDREGTLD